MFFTYCSFCGHIGKCILYVENAILAYVTVVFLVHQGYEADGPRITYKFPFRQIFSSLQCSHWLSHKMCTGILSLWVKCPGCEVDQSFASSAKDKNMCSHSSTTPCLQGMVLNEA